MPAGVITPRTHVIAAHHAQQAHTHLLVRMLRLSVSVAQLANTYQALLATTAAQVNTAPQPVVSVPVFALIVLQEPPLLLEQQVALHALLVVTQAVTLPAALLVRLVTTAPEGDARAALHVPQVPF